jgi:RHS repeat-associated protein
MIAKHLACDPSVVLCPRRTRRRVICFEEAHDLLASIDGGNTASFVYGPFGRRISKTVYGTSTNYLYDGVNVVQELSGGTPSANLLTGGLDEVFTRTDSSGSYNFLRDGLGSTLALTDSTGTVQQTYTYGPYGYTSTSGNTTSNSYEYIGRETDATGLDYFRARYYNPNAGRFLSEDPAGFAGDGANLFAYVGDDPTDFIDPFGMDRKDPFPSKSHCLWNAVKEEKVSLALDVTSLTIDAVAPEGQYVRLAWGGALSAAAAINSASKGDTAGVGLGVASHLRPLAELSTAGMSWKWAEWIPEFGTAMDLITTAHDISTTVDEYDTCMAN